MHGWVGEARTTSLLEQLEMGDGRHEPGAVPLFVGEFEIALCKPDRKPIALVVPKADYLAAWTGISLALSRTVSGFDRRVEKQARQGFSIGERVRVMPSGHVYVYAGYFPSQYGSFIKLAVPDDASGTCRSFPAGQIGRLEKTDRQLPRGKGESALGKASPTLLDSFLGTESCGNRDLFATEVVILTSRARFEELCNTLTLSRDDPQRFSGVNASDILPTGRLSVDGHVVPLNSGAARGRPLIAVASSVEAVHAFASRHRADNPCIIVDGAARASREPAVFGRLIGNAAPVIIASEHESEPLAFLAGLGVNICRVPEKLIMHSSAGAARGIFSGFAKQVANSIHLKGIGITGVSCPQIDTAADDLEGAARHLQAAQVDDADIGLLRQAFRKLIEWANSLAENEILEIRSELVVLGQRYRQRASFWPPEARDHFEAALRKLDGASADLVAAVLKCEAIEKILGRKLSPDETSGRGFRSFTAVRDGGTITVLSGWPGRQRLEDIVYSFVAPTVSAVAFRFEARWFESFNRSYRLRKRAGRPVAPSPEDPFGSHREYTVEEPDASPATRPAASELPPIETFLARYGGRQSSSGSRPDEDIIPAYEVLLEDGRTIYLSEYHDCPVISGLNDISGSQAPRVQFVQPSALEPGDLVSFRSGTDGDIVRLFAEAHTGRDRYAQLRELADRWRRPLRAIATYPPITFNGETYQPPDAAAIHRKLESAGLGKGKATVRNWIFNRNLIGPGELTDLQLIARVSQDPELMASVDVVWGAIAGLRAIHIHAGMDLSKALLDELPARMLATGRRTGRFELSFGELEIVEVAEVSPAKINVTAELINRLTNDDIW